MENCQTLANCYEFQLFKVIAENFSLWPIVFLITFLALLVWAIWNPAQFSALFNRVESVKISGVEVKLSKLEEKFKETNLQLVELEEENSRLNSLYTTFDPDAPKEALEKVRQELKVLAGNMDDSSPILDGLRSGADPEDIFAAAEILRTNRDFSMFDPLIASIDRIASDPKLEGLRYQTVWSLASAAHRIILAAVKHSDDPKLTTAQLETARSALTKLGSNPHVQLDRPDSPKQGIRGPVGYALNWIEIGLEKQLKAK